MDCYILCKRHGYKKDYAFLFWGPDHCGYSYDLGRAGKYKIDDPRLKSLHPCDDALVSCAEVDALATTTIIDHSRLARVCCNTKATRSKLKVALKELHSGNTSWSASAFMSPAEFARKHKNTLEVLKDIEHLEQEANNG